MAEPAIRVDGVAKRYRLDRGRDRAAYRTLRESLAGAAGAAFRKRRTTEEFWALDGVSFEVQPGEVVGIIGRNGSGKSTLLKILSRITRPTRGTADLNGRVGSLLEVGTGFHPELTGRENVFLNGSILGMKRREIAARFDEIVAFAEVEKFLDTPVKRYSSGMYVRLAFAVAAHLEPEILIVDEVLAVGDGQFQKKCLGRMGEIARGGRTVLFVSHSMPTVARLCTRGLLLDGGRLTADGPVEAAVRAYLGAGDASPAYRAWPAAAGPGSDIVRLRSVRVADESGGTVHAVDIRRPVALEMDYEVTEGGHRFLPGLQIFNADGVCAFGTIDRGTYARPAQPAGRYRAAVRVPGNFLAEGTHLVTANMSTIEPEAAFQFSAPEAVAFEVKDTPDGDSVRGRYPGQFPGVVRPDLPWTLDPAPDPGPGQ